ncbi:MAG: crossover junction endodeoxyribonuclease RuvC [Anaerolineales bacterium]
MATTAIGVDPGTAITGYGVVRETPDGLVCVAYGAVTTPAGEPLPRRLQAIYRGLREVVAEHRPTSGAVEKLFFQKNVRTAMTVSQGRGVAMLALADCGLDVGEYTPLEVKQAVAGYGGAPKQQVQLMVQTLLGLDDLPRPDDAADALAVAICHLHSARMRDILEA